MPTIRKAMPAFDFHPQHYNIIALAKDENPLGQLVNFNPASTVQEQTLNRIGDSATYRARTTKDSTLALDIIIHRDLKELALLLGFDRAPATGEIITLDLSKPPIDLLLITYDKEALGATEMYRRYLQGWQSNSLAETVNPGTTNTANLSGTLVNWWYIKG